MDRYQKSISLPDNAKGQFSFLQFFSATIAISFFSLKMAAKEIISPPLNFYSAHNEMI